MPTLTLLVLALLAISLVLAISALWDIIRFNRNLKKRHELLTTNSTIKPKDGRLRQRRTRQ